MLAAPAYTRQLPPEIRPTPARGGAGARPRGCPGCPGPAAAAIVVAVVFGVTHANTRQQLSPARAQNQALAAAQVKVEAELSQARRPRQALAEILGAPNVTLLSQATTKGGVATVVLAAAKRQLVVAMSGLPALPAGKVYQLWLIGPIKIVSARRAAARTGCPLPWSRPASSPATSSA